jgi:DedD protein
MGLLTLFKRNDQKPAEPAATPDAVAQARTHARRRLIGATVLLVIGVIGFPLLFETQPRPVRMDIPIEIPAKDNAPPLALPPSAAPAAEAASAATLAQPAAPTAPASRPVAAASAARDAGPVITERAGEQGRELPLAAATPASAVPPPKPAPKPPTVAAQAPVPAPAPADDGERARAILEGRAVPAAAAPASAPRLVVQVGAYTDADKLSEVRQKVEKLGLKTYIQVVDVGGEKRTRVRIGPFPTKAEADKTAARIKAAGLPVAVLTL